MSRRPYLIGSNLPGRNLPIFEKGGKFLPGNLKHRQVMESRLKKKENNLRKTIFIFRLYNQQI